MSSYHRLRLGSTRSLESDSQDTTEEEEDALDEKEDLLNSALLSFEYQLKIASSKDSSQTRKELKHFFTHWKTLTIRQKGTRVARSTTPFSRPLSSSELAAKVISLDKEREHREVYETASVLRNQVTELETVLKEQDETIEALLRRVNQLEWHRLIWALVGGVSVPGLVLAVLSHDLDLHDWEATWEIVALWGVGVIAMLVFLAMLVRRVGGRSASGVDESFHQAEYRLKQEKNSRETENWGVINLNPKGLRKRKNSSNHKKKPSGDVRRRMSSSSRKNQSTYMDQRTVVELTV